MPKKVILYGDGLKLLNTIIDYIEARPDELSSVLYYEKDALIQRNALLKRQLEEGVSISWDYLEAELEEQKKESQR